MTIDNQSIFLSQHQVTDNDHHTGHEDRRIAADTPRLGILQQLRTILADHGQTVRQAGNTRVSVQYLKLPDEDNERLEMALFDSVLSTFKW